MTSPSDTRYCLPPVLITAYIFALLIHLDSPDTVPPSGFRTSPSGSETFAVSYRTKPHRECSIVGKQCQSGSPLSTPVNASISVVFFSRNYVVGAVSFLRQELRFVGLNKDPQRFFPRFVRFVRSLYVNGIQPAEFSAPTAFCAAFVASFGQAPRLDLVRTSGNTSIASGSGTLASSSTTSAGGFFSCGGDVWFFFGYVLRCRLFHVRNLVFCVVSFRLRTVFATVIFSFIIQRSDVSSVNFFFLRRRRGFFFWALPAGCFFFRRSPPQRWLLPRQPWLYFFDRGFKNDRFGSFLAASVTARIFFVGFLCLTLSSKSTVAPITSTAAKSTRSSESKNGPITISYRSQPHFQRADRPSGDIHGKFLRHQRLHFFGG